MRKENYEHLKNNLPLVHEGMTRMIKEGMKWEDWANDLQSLVDDLVEYFGENEDIAIGFLRASTKSRA